MEPIFGRILGPYSGGCHESDYIKILMKIFFPTNPSFLPFFASEFCWESCIYLVIFFSIMKYRSTPFLLDWFFSQKWFCLKLLKNNFYFFKLYGIHDFTFYYINIKIHIIFNWLWSNVTLWLFHQTFPCISINYKWLEIGDNQQFGDR